MQLLKKRDKKGQPLFMQILLLVLIKGELQASTFYAILVNFKRKSNTTNYASAVKKRELAELHKQ